MSSLPSFTTVCAALVSDPWCLSVDQIAKLTDFQIYEIYFHPRDPETGALKQKTPTLVLEDPDDPHEILFAYGRALQIPEEELQRVWDNRPRKEGNADGNP